MYILTCAYLSKYTWHGNKSETSRDKGPEKGSGESDEE